MSGEALWVASAHLQGTYRFMGNLGFLEQDTVGTQVTKTGGQIFSISLLMAVYSIFEWTGRK
jgi:hypothetical protein